MFLEQNLVLCLHVVTTACYFNVLLKSPRGGKGRICGQGPSALPGVTLLWKSHRHIQKELENRQAKLLLFKSTGIQILKLPGDQLLNPEDYTSVVSKRDESLGTDPGILINQVKAVFISTSFPTTGFL